MAYRKIFVNQAPTFWHSDAQQFAAAVMAAGTTSAERGGYWAAPLAKSAAMAAT